MKKFNLKKLTALLSAVVMLMGLFCLPVSAGSDDGFNDVELWWPCDHAGNAACATICKDCKREIEPSVDHTYESDADCYCNVCQGYRFAIITQPASIQVKKDATAKLSVKAVGDGLTYQWYIKNAGKTKYSKSSVTKATYSTTMSDSSRDRYVYCIVKDKNGNEIKSKTVVLRMAATITKEPATAAYAQNGKKVSVKITVAGDGLTYTWYIKNDGASKYTKSSITSATYSATMSSKVKGRRIYCVVKDKYGKKAQSKTFLLRESVSLTTEPATSYKVKIGATAKVTIKASGDGLKYTWYIKNDGASKYTKSSITKSTYSVKMASKVHNRRLYCVITDKYGNKLQTKTMILKKK